MNVFPPWTNKLKFVLAGVGAYLGAVALFIVSYGFSPKTTDVGYQPEQPIPFSHAQHAGKLGLDCRYCHQTVEKANYASVPSSETCMACHERIHDQSSKLAPLRTAWAGGEAVRWKRVHDLPDYAYFDHSVHVGAGVGCVECHGRIDQMAVVRQEKPLSMGWCLECHRDPGPHIRPRHLVTQMASPAEDYWAPTTVAPPHDLPQPSQDCSACHR